MHTAATAAWQNHIISRGRLTHEVPAFARAADRCRCPCILHKYRRCHSFTMDGVCHACARTMPDDTEPCFDQMTDLSPILEPSLQDGHRMWLYAWCPCRSRQSSMQPLRKQPSQQDAERTQAHTAHAHSLTLAKPPAHVQPYRGANLQTTADTT